MRHLERPGEVRPVRDRPWRGATMTGVPGGTLHLADDLEIARIGYGAMRLPGPNVMGPPSDRDAALEVIRTAVELGVNHIDTADFYGPAVANELVRDALGPYPAGLHIATKVGTVRGEDGSWNPSLDPESLERQVHDNLEHLGAERLDLVYLRLAAHGRPVDVPIGREFTALAELQRQGLIRHLGLSGITDAQLSEAQAIAPVVAVQNLYNLADRHDDALVDRAAREGIAFVSYFPLGGFRPLRSTMLDQVAAETGASPAQVALAWLLHRSPTSVVIPGTASVAHLRENVAAGDIDLSAEVLARLDSIAPASEH